MAFKGGVVLGTVNLNISGSASTSIGSGTNTGTNSIGSITGASGIVERVGTGNFSLDGVTNSTYTIGASTTTGTITIGGTAQTGTMTLGSSSGTNIIAIGAGAGATTVNIANAQVAGAVNIGAGMTTGTITIGGTGLQTGTITIGGGTGAQTLNFGTGGTGAKTVNIGSSASTGTTTLQAGSGGVKLQAVAEGALVTSSTSVISTVTGTAGFVLTANTAGTAPSFQAPASGGITFSVITADQNAVVNNGYICNKAGLLTLTLPVTAAAGTQIECTGMNTALGWKIGQNASQIIHFGTSNTSTGTGGSLASSAIRDSVRLVCVVANLEWNVLSSLGNITIV